MLLLTLSAQENPEFAITRYQTTTNIYDSQCQRPTYNLRLMPRKHRLGVQRRDMAGLLVGAVILLSIKGYYLFLISRYLFVTCH
jgi:hypothetical protein